MFPSYYEIFVIKMDLSYANVCHTFLSVNLTDSFHEHFCLVFFVVFNDKGESAICIQ